MIRYHFIQILQLIFKSMSSEINLQLKKSELFPINLGIQADRTLNKDFLIHSIKITVFIIIVTIFIHSISPRKIIIKVPQIEQSEFGIVEKVTLDQVNPFNRKLEVYIQATKYNFSIIQQVEISSIRGDQQYQQIAVNRQFAKPQPIPKQKQLYKYYIGDVRVLDESDYLIKIIRPKNIKQEVTTAILPPSNQIVQQKKEQNTSKKEANKDEKQIKNPSPSKQQEKTQKNQKKSQQDQQKEQKKKQQGLNDRIQTKKIGQQGNKQVLGPQQDKDKQILQVNEQTAKDQIQQKKKDQIQQKKKDQIQQKKKDQIQQKKKDQIQQKKKEQIQQKKKDQIQQKKKDQIQQKANDDQKTKQQQQRKSKEEQKRKDQQREKQQHQKQSEKSNFVIKFYLNTSFYTIFQLIVRYISFMVVIYTYLQNNGCNKFVSLICLIYTNPLIFIQIAYPTQLGNIIDALSESSYMMFFGVWLIYTHPSSKGWWNILLLTCKVGLAVLLYLTHVINQIYGSLTIQFLQFILILTAFAILSKFLSATIINYRKQLHRNLIYISVTLHYLVLLWVCYRISGLQYGIVMYIILQLYGRQLMKLSTPNIIYKINNSPQTKPINNEINSNLEEQTNKVGDE